jgi:hypothetical protein
LEHLPSLQEHEKLLTSLKELFKFNDEMHLVSLIALIQTLGPSIPLSWLQLLIYSLPPTALSFLAFIRPSARNRRLKSRPSVQVSGLVVLLVESNPK